MSEQRVSVVIPVYADWNSLNECLTSLKKHLSSRHKVFLVNDCGPKADILEIRIKKAISGLPNYKYYRNPKNLGFLKTCNRAVLELDKTGNDILILNSDTKVTKGFLDEMLAVLYSNEKIGAVSPRTNNATIATVPLSAMPQKGIEPEKSYKKFLELKEKLPRHSVVPTAHGFCMLIRRSLIGKYGLFDEVFGMGYGEEVDFCQRIKEHGYISVLSNHSYVFHHEARSFTLETKNKMLEENNQIIRRRYPNYQRLVREYIEGALVFEEGTGTKKPANRVSSLTRRAYRTSRDKLPWLR